ncbi:MAG: hypothetical protein ACLGSD_02380 [Acidobacteriota bacterium]
MKSAIVMASILLAGNSIAGQTAKLSDWPGLLDKKKVADAKALCDRYAVSKLISEQVEAQKCLANVALSGNDQMLIEKDDAGGGTLRDSYSPASVDQALQHLNLGIELAPQDLSIHQGRLHVLEMAGRYDDMVKALDESATTYKGQDALQAWLAYASELSDLRQYQAGLDFMKVLDKHYPGSPDVLGNIGAFLDMLGKDREAMPYLKRAVELAPKDPINAWDLARAYDFAGQTELADQWYHKALELMTDADQLKQSRCLYAKFVEKKLKDRTRACALQKGNCETGAQTACSESSAQTP